jgi:hypothetical protein
VSVPAVIMSCTIHGIQCSLAYTLLQAEIKNSFLTVVKHFLFLRNFTYNPKLLATLRLYFQIFAKMGNPKISCFNFKFLFFFFFVKMAKLFFFFFFHPHGCGSLDPQLVRSRVTISMAKHGSQDPYDIYFFQQKILGILTKNR